MAQAVIVAAASYDSFFWINSLFQRESEIPMSPQSEKIFLRAHELPAEERVRLAEELLASVCDHDVALEAEWDLEIQRRLAQIENGTAKLVPADEVFAEIRRLIS
jgi:putative addiction module component (TIGR02574 family)